MFVSYLRVFARMGLKAIPMAADSGPIGGNLSHEFLIRADTGESALYFHRDWNDMDVLGSEINHEDNLEAVMDYWTRLYAATDDKHDPDTCPVAPEDLVSARGIEVGHIFYFGTKYSDSMNCRVNTADGASTAIHGGSYGIGVSRLAGAIIEASHDDDGIIWPDSVAPFAVGIIDLKPGDKACAAACDEIYGKLTAAGLEVLHDDTEDRAGAKFAAMDLIGLPWQVIVGPRGVADGKVEVKRRATGERQELSIESAIAHITG
jgi:prolyl-tRNA synthetase